MFHLLECRCCILIIEKYFFLATVQSCPEVNLQTVLTVNWSLDSRDDQIHYLHNILYKEKIQFKGWENPDTPLVICGDTALSWINCWSWVLITNTWESGHNFQTHHISQRQLFRSARTSRRGYVYVVYMLSICCLYVYVVYIYWSQQKFDGTCCMYDIY